MTTGSRPPAIGPAELLLATTVAAALAVGLTGYRVGRRVPGGAAGAARGLSRAANGGSVPVGPATDRGNGRRPGGAAERVRD